MTIPGHADAVHAALGPPPSRGAGSEARARPRVEFPLSHLLFNCLIGAAMWAGIIALVWWALT